MQTMLQDFRYAFRQLCRAPGFAITAVLTLALGIGANTAIFSAVYNILLRSLPFRGAGQLVTVQETHPKIAGAEAASYPDFLDLRAQSKSFEHLAAYWRNLGKSQLVNNGQAQAVQVTLASADLLPSLGISPEIGRGFLPEADTDRGIHEVILNHALWRSLFGGKPNVVGQAVQIDAESFVVVGVLRSGQQFPANSDVWLPIAQMSPALPNNRKYHETEIVGRLHTGVTLQQAAAELAAIAARLAQTYPATNRDEGMRLTPIREALVGHLRPALLVLFGSVALVLLIACANIANLLLVRATARDPEIALRMALGATRARLLRQFLVESLTLASLGAFVGVILAAAAIPLLRSALNQLGKDQLAAMPTVMLSLPVLGFTSLVTVLTGIAFGFVPVFQIGRRQGNGVGSNERNITTGQNPARNLLAIGEMALAVMVLFGAMLLLRSLQKLLAVDPGFRTDHLLAVKIDLPAKAYPDDVHVNSFAMELLGEIERLPGVVSAATTSALPLVPSVYATRFAVEGAPAPAAGNWPVTQVRFVSPSYFRTLGIGLVEGRPFQLNDVGNPTGMFLVNRCFAQRYLSDRDPVGRKILMNVLSAHPVPTPVIGVVEDAKDLGVDTSTQPVIYAPGYSNTGVLLVRTSNEPQALTLSVRQVVSALDRNLALSEVTTMDGVLSDSLARERLSAFLLGLFAILSVVLATIGVYGVVAYTVAQRTREIGVRMALGAQRFDVIGLFLKQGSILVGMGTVVGLLAALCVSPLLRSLLFETAATDPVSIAASTALLIAMGIAATWVPALRASRVQPMQALRTE
jgi:predicted permease